MIRAGHLLQDIPVELFLAVSQKLPDHLSAEPLTLQKEMGHSNWRVWYEASRDQELDPFVWISAKSREIKVRCILTILQFLSKKRL